MIKTILLADDSITMQKVIRLTFASGGYKLLTADNGDEAIKKAEDSMPHIVLVDAALPGKNGYEVCEAIKNNPQLKDTPVIILAGTFNPLDKNEAFRVKADDSIVKPFESKHLIEKVEHLFREFPPVDRETTAPESVEVNAWEDDDIIKAPEPSPAPSDRASFHTEEPLTGEIEVTQELPDLETFDGRGSPGETDSEEAEGLTTDTSDKTGEPMPKMTTAAGESEGEGGFDIEGFEINPFKSEPLREEPIFEEPKETPGEWSVDEEDVAGFNGLEPEREIEAEEEPAGIEETAEEGSPEGGPAEAEEKTSEGESAEEDAVRTEAEEGPVEVEEKISEDEAITKEEPPEEDIIVAEEESVEKDTGTISPEESCAEVEAEEDIIVSDEESAEEAGAIEPEEEPAGIEIEENISECEATAGAVEPKDECAQPSPVKAVDKTSETAIRELVRKASMDVIEEVVRDVVPGLIKKAVEDEMERIKESIKGL